MTARVPACEDVFSGLPLVACPRTMEGWGVTSQISDEVRFHGVWYAITAVDGAGLFELTEHGPGQSTRERSATSGSQRRCPSPDGYCLGPIMSTWAT
jgi:hypothetical protein